MAECLVGMWNTLNALKRVQIISLEYCRGVEEDLFDVERKVVHNVAGMRPKESLGLYSSTVFQLLVYCCENVRNDNEIHHLFLSFWKGRLQVACPFTSFILEPVSFVDFRLIFRFLESNEVLVNLSLASRQRYSFAQEATHGRNLPHETVLHFVKQIAPLH